MTKTKAGKILDQLISELGSDFVVYKVSDYYKSNLIFFRDDKNELCIAEEITLASIKGRNYQLTDKVDYLDMNFNELLRRFTKHKRYLGMVPGKFVESIKEWNDWYSNGDNKHKVDTVIAKLKSEKRI